VRIFAIARHAQTLLNVEHKVNGDWTVDVPLTAQGEDEARRLGVQVAHLPLELCIHTRFPRTGRTAGLALDGRDVPLAVEPLLDDLYIGKLDGRSVDDYRAWKAEHVRSDSFPGGESLDDAAARYAAGYRKLLEGSHAAVLVVCHEIPLRYALNAASDSNDLDWPVHAISNATPYFFDEHALERAADRIETLAG